MAGGWVDVEVAEGRGRLRGCDRNSQGRLYLWCEQRDPGSSTSGQAAETRRLTAACLVPGFSFVFLPSVGTFAGMLVLPLHP